MASIAISLDDVTSSVEEKLTFAVRERNDEQTIVTIPFMSNSVQCLPFSNVNIHLSKSSYPKSDYLTGLELLGPDLTSAQEFLINFGGNCGTCLGRKGVWFPVFVCPHSYDTPPIRLHHSRRPSRHCVQKDWRPLSVFVPKSHLDANYYTPYMFQGKYSCSEFDTL